MSDTHLIPTTAPSLIRCPAVEWPRTLCCGRPAEDLLTENGGTLHVTVEPDRVTCHHGLREAMDAAWRTRVGLAPLAPLPSAPAPALPTDTGLGDLPPPVQESPPGRE